MQKLEADLNGKNGKRVQQLALAKLTTGASLMYTFANMAYGGSGGDQDVMITGMAPMNKAAGGKRCLFRKWLYAILYLQYWIKNIVKYWFNIYARFGS